MEFVFLILGLITGGAIGFLFERARRKTGPENEEVSQLNAQIHALETEKSTLTERLNSSINYFSEQQNELKQERQKVEQLRSEIGKSESENKNLLEKLETQKVEMEEIREKFTREFENIANKLLKQNSSEFAEANQKRLDQILKPFRDKIVDFEKAVTDAYDKETKDRNSLKGEIKQLVELNQKISTEANNLARALKGDSKKQGNWGEIVLEKVLERSGLVKDREYTTQFSTQNQDGKRIQPDVIVNLPDEKHIIIDSKVSLLDYEKYINADTETGKQLALKNHLNSVRTHIKGLSEKNYQLGKDINTPDFVLLFIPIESSFSEVIKADHDLFSFAWERKIVIVSPTTLLATLRTIASLWKQERQTKNALEIAHQSGALYDKFVGFLSDMEKIERGLASSQTAYNDAMNKLKSGSGNLIRRTEKIRKLGAKTSKIIPDKFVGGEDPGLFVEEEK